MADQMQWDQGSVEDVRRRMVEYGNRVLWVRMQVAQYWVAVFEAEAKQNAPWTDRTGNARQSLHAYAEELANSAVAIYLSHGVNYGIYLETMQAGRYGVIMDVLERHYQEVMNMVEAIFR